MTGYVTKQGQVPLFAASGWLCCQTPRKSASDDLLTDGYRASGLGPVSDVWPMVVIVRRSCH